MSPGDSLVEGLALSLSDTELESGRLARAVASREGTGTPGGSAVDLVEVGEVSEGGLVSERDVDESVMGQGGHAGDSSALLSATEGSGGDEETSVLAPERTLRPLLSRLVPECLDLCGEVTCGGSVNSPNASSVCVSYHNVWGYRKGYHRTPRAGKGPRVR